MTTHKTLRTSLFSIVALGSSFTAAVEAAALVGTVAVVPTALYLGLGGASANSAVAQAHAAKLTRLAAAQTAHNLAYAAPATSRAAG